MENVKDITSLEAYNEYVEASTNLADYQRQKEIRQRNIFDLFDRSKALRMDAEMADNFREMEEKENEANRLLKEAKEAQRELDKFEEQQPHYGNLRGEALRKLQDEGKEFIGSLFELAEAEINDAVEILQAINGSKGKFKNNEAKFIPSVSHVLDDLQIVKKDLNPNT